MIKAKVIYIVKDRKTFENKVLPYIYGGGIFYKFDIEFESKQNNFSIIIETNTLSQLITAITGMLRYSHDCFLQNVEILKTKKVDFKSDKKLDLRRPLLGIILKPSLSYKPDIARKVLEHAVKNKIDFIKDDDASEYSVKESRQIKRLVGDIPYFQKITKPSDLVSNYAMIVPWVDGWPLLEVTSKKTSTINHCANLSPQISWRSHIIFSRLAGVIATVVPDLLFDKKFNLDLALESATKDIKGVKPIRLLISGGITPERITSILKNVNKEYHKNIGFSVGSWLLSHSNDIARNYYLLKRAVMKY